MQFWNDIMSPRGQWVEGHCSTTFQAIAVNYILPHRYKSSNQITENDFDYYIKLRGTTGTLMYQMLSKSINLTVPYLIAPLKQLYQHIVERMNEAVYRENMTYQPLSDTQATGWKATSGKSKWSSGGGTHDLSALIRYTGGRMKDNWSGLM